VCDIITHKTRLIWRIPIHKINIDPADTRKILAMGIAASVNKEFGEPDFGVFRM